MRKSPRSKHVTTIFDIERRLAQLRNQAEEHEPRGTETLSPEEAEAVRRYLRMHALKETGFEVKEPDAARVLDALVQRITYSGEEMLEEDHERLGLEAL